MEAVAGLIAKEVTGMSGLAWLYRSLVRGEGERDGLLRREEDRSKVYGAVGG